MKIANNKLSGDQTAFQPSPNHGGTFKAPSPDTLVIRPFAR